MNKNSRIQNSIHNVSIGILATVVNTLVAFVTRTVLVKTLGVEVLGLNGLFTEVITMLSLMELGVGMAIIYSLYKPVIENDEEKISQLMGLYRTAYRIVGFATLAVGLMITPVVDKLITDVDYPLSFIRTIFILFVLRTSSSYFFAYKISLINADQKQFVVSLVTTIVKIALTILVIIVLVLFKNYILYLVLLIAQSLITNFIISKYADKKYPFINYKSKIDINERHAIFANIRDIFLKRLSGVITSSTDNILISKLISTVQVGFYSNYVLLFSVVRTIKQQFTNGIAASIGNLSVTSDSEHCISVLKRLTLLFYLFAMIMASGLMGVSRIFVTMWLGKECVMEDYIVYVTIFVLFLEICSEPLWQFLEVSGLFRQDKYIGMIGSIVNLIVSFVLGIKIGIIGIFIGTVCTEVIQIVLKTRLIFKGKFFALPTSYCGFWLKMVLSYVMMVLFHFCVFRHVSISSYLILEFLIKGFASVIVATILAVLPFLRNDEFRYCVQLLKQFKTKLLCGRMPKNG